MIRVLLVDDHGVIRVGLERLMSTTEDLELVGTAATGELAVELAAAHEPDVVLMDLSLPGMDGVAAARAILSAQPHARVLVLTSASDRPRILAALDAGAAGYLLKDSEPDELFDGIRAAARGETPLAAEAVAALHARTSGEGTGELTHREREVLELVADGLPNKVIARRLGIREKTVKAHLTRVYLQIGVSDRTQAALWLRHGA